MRACVCVSVCVHARKVMCVFFCLCVRVFVRACVCVTQIGTSLSLGRVSGLTCVYAIIKLYLHHGSKRVWAKSINFVHAVPCRAMPCRESRAKTFQFHCLSGNAFLDATLHLFTRVYVCLSISQSIRACVYLSVCPDFFFQNDGGWGGMTRGGG